MVYGRLNVLGAKLALLVQIGECGLGAADTRRAGAENNGATVGTEAVLRRFHGVYEAVLFKPASGQAIVTAQLRCMHDDIFVFQPDDAAAVEALLDAAAYTSLIEG